MLRRFSFLMIAAYALIVGNPGFAQQVAPLPVAIAPTDSYLRYEGRWDTRAAAGPRCSWSASAVHLRFSGKALNILLSETGDNDEYEIVVDGTPAASLVATSGMHLYSIFSAPESGTHMIALVKRTEAFCGIGQIQGFQLSEGGGLLAPMPAPPHKIEVIGDSISCGYGNEGKDQNEHFTPATENAYLSYGAVAARTLGADYACIAWSGRLMWPTNTMGEVYDQTLPTDPGSHWDFTRWLPDVVVINLGTNDFSKGVPNESAWTTAYEAFMTRVRQHYPQATIYVASSPMMAGDSDKIEREYLHKIIADENAAGDARVKFMDFKTQDLADGLGADWHPSVKTDQIMADAMVSTIRADLGWKPVAAR